MFVEKLKDGTTKITGARIDLLDAWPVHSIFMNVSVISPSVFFGGVWERFGQGRVLIGVDELDPPFDTPEEIGPGTGHSEPSTGGQPYITVYMWKRVS